MDFPNLVYRCPGPHQRPGGTFGSKQVADDAALQAALADGWFATLPQAIEGKAPAAVVAAADDAALQAEEVAMNAPPTRAELEAKAAELGMTFDGRTSDKTLAAKIAVKLAEQAKA